MYRSMHRTSTALAALIALDAATPASAQNETSREAADDDVIIVTGLRLPAPATETGSAVTVITAEEIEKRAYAFALDAVAAAPGVTTNQNGTFGGLASVRIRGSAAGQTLVILDGVPLGDPTSVDGGYDFSVFDAAEIARIEVLKGPQSTLWGSDAIGGVVNIVSKAPEPGLALRGFAEGGSFAAFRGGAAASVAGDVGDLRLAVSGARTDGISRADEDDGNTERDAYNNLTYTAKGGLNLPRDIRLEATARFIDSEAEIDGFPPPDFALADSDDRSETEQFAGAATLRAPLFDDRVKTEFLAGYADIERRGEFGGFETLDEGDRLILRHQTTAEATDWSRVALGADHEENEANGENTSITGLFGLLELQPLDGLTLTGGVRNDDHSDFGSETTARFAAAWKIAPFLTLKGSWGEGFKAPTIFQLTQTFGALPPNGDLEPEESEAFDIGVVLATPDGRGALEATYFNQDTDNLIIFAPNFRYENLEATSSEGVEIAARYALAPWLTATVDYAYIDAVDETTGSAKSASPAILATSRSASIQKDRSQALSSCAITARRLTARSAKTSTRGRESTYPRHTK